MMRWDGRWDDEIRDEMEKWLEEIRWDGRLWDR